MSGIIIIRADTSEEARIRDVLSRLLDFVLSLPFPRAFMAETKFVAGRDAVILRGRDAETQEIKTLHVKAGITTQRQIRQFFAY